MAPFRSNQGGTRYELSYTDYEEADRFPFHDWIERGEKAVGGVASLGAMDAWLWNELLPSGAKAMLVVNYGMPDMQRIDY